MSILISPIEHRITRRFRVDKRTEKEFSFEFKPGEPVEIPEVCGEFAESLNSTFPEKYFTEEEWKEFKKAEEKAPETISVTNEATGEEIKKTPTLEELLSKPIDELKSTADEIGLQYGYNITVKTLASRIFEFITQPVEII